MIIIIDKDDKNEKSYSKRKRIKLECLECSQTFDRDYYLNTNKRINYVTYVSTY